ncbi:MAG: hypothetical protein O7H39_17970 [Gammaproteobacteria bacterium]|nr:hypothetical protein [Gammaproteobacteria bacterium]
MAFESWYRKKIRDTLRYDGVLILFWKVLVKGLSPFCRLGMEILFEKDLTRPLKSSYARVDVLVGEATEADVDQLVALEFGTPIDDETNLSDAEEFAEAVRAQMRACVTEEYLDAFRRGDKCFIGKVGDEIVHKNWTRFQWVQPIPGCEFSLQTGEEVFTSDAFTPEDWRGYGIHEFVNNEMLRSARQAGYRRAYTMTDITKTGSRRGVLRVGWERCGKLLYLIPRGLGKTFIIRLGGSLGPLVRSLEPDEEGQ